MTDRVLLCVAVSKMPRLSTVENIMKVSQMVVQALWDNKSSLLQLPHISEDQLRHFVTRKVRTRVCHHVYSCYHLWS